MLFVRKCFVSGGSSVTVVSGCGVNEGLIPDNVRGFSFYHRVSAHIQCQSIDCVELYFLGPCMPSWHTV